MKKVKFKMADYEQVQMKKENSTGHTPGPWNLVMGCHDFTIHAGTTIAEGNMDAVEWKANARLIAAAPELLEACEKALELFNCHTDTFMGVYRSPDEIDAIEHTARQMMREAVRKAKGSL